MEISRDAEVYDILFKSGTSFWLERFGYKVAVLQAEFRNHFSHSKKCGTKGKCF